MRLGRREGKCKGGRVCDRERERERETETGGRAGPAREIEELRERKSEKTEEDAGRKRERV